VPGGSDGGVGTVVGCGAVEVGFGIEEVDWASVRGINEVDKMHMMVDVITRRSQEEVRENGDLMAEREPMGRIVKRD
jgi:hypothetical protein